MDEKILINYLLLLLGPTQQLVWKVAVVIFLFLIAKIVLFKLKLTSIVFNPQLVKLSSIYLENKPLKYKWKKGRNWDIAENITGAISF